MLNAEAVEIYTENLKEGSVVVQFSEFEGFMPIDRKKNVHRSSYRHFLNASQHFIIRGQIDPQKFAKVYDDLAKTYGQELTQEMMGFADEAEFEKLYQSVKRALPPELQKGLEEAKKEIKTIAGLSQILNSLFAKYGDTLKYSFMTFEYGGRKHTVVMMDRKLKDQVELLKKYCIEYKKGICPLLTDAIRTLFKGGIE